MSIPASAYSVARSGQAGHGPAYYTLDHSGGASSPSSGSYSGLVDRLLSMAAANNSWSAAQAERQMAYQTVSNAKAMQFNHDEAELNRQWQEYMSSTAHQREVKDLQLAGLNPILSAMGGSGAPVTSGATASGYSSQGAKGDVDTSLISGLVGLISTAMQTQASMANTIMSAQTQKDIAELGAGVDLSLGQLSSNTALQVADRNNQASIQVAKIHAGATLSAANISALASQAVAHINGQYNLSQTQMNNLNHIITTSLNNATSKEIASKNRVSDQAIASMNAQLQRDLQAQGFQNSLELQYDRQSHEWKLNLTSDIINGLFGLGKAAIYSGALKQPEEKKFPIGFRSNSD